MNEPTPCQKLKALLEELRTIVDEETRRLWYRQHWQEIVDLVLLIVPGWPPGVSDPELTDKYLEETYAGLGDLLSGPCGWDDDGA